MIKNFDTARQVVANAENAEGSALEENQKYMQSIEGHADLLKNKWQEVWANSINRETINFFLDLTRGVLELVDALGAIPTALGAMSFFGLAKGGGRGKIASPRINTFLYINMPPKRLMVTCTSYI